MERTKELIGVVLRVCEQLFAQPHTKPQCGTFRMRIKRIILKFKP